MDKAQQECPICLDQKSSTLTICNHYFCERCIKQALKKYNYCPMCRHFDPLNPNLKQQKPKNVPSKYQWNVEIARNVLFKKISENQEQVYLKNQQGQIQSTNIYVGKNAKINVNSSVNIQINGKKVNPNECNHQ